VGVKAPVVAIYAVSLVVAAVGMVTILAIVPPLNP
jgi:hypothetical protein